jgi:hypothetical protein
MAKYLNPTTTAVSSSSVAIKTGLVTGDIVEVFAKDDAIWVHTTGGTAAADAAGCEFVPENGWIEIAVTSGTTQLTAIRVTTDAKAIVSKVA